MSRRVIRRSRIRVKRLLTTHAHTHTHTRRVFLKAFYRYVRRVLSANVCVCVT